MPHCFVCVAPAAPPPPPEQLCDDRVEHGTFDGSYILLFFSYFPPDGVGPQGVGELPVSPGAGLPRGGGLGLPAPLLLQRQLQLLRGRLHAPDAGGLRGALHVHAGYTAPCLLIVALHVFLFE